jgi:hypothetical protein
MSSLCVNSQMIYWDLANVKILNHSSFTINDLIRVVTLHATLLASGSLSYLVGCGVASNDSNQVCYLEHRMMLTKATGDEESWFRVACEY